MNQFHGRFLQLSLKANDDYQDPILSLSTNANLQTVPQFLGIPLKYLSLITLAVQNSMLTIIMHYSRISTPPNHAYSAATAVLLNELFKGLISLVVAFVRLDNVESSLVESNPAYSPKIILTLFRKLGKDVFAPDCWKLSIPAILYVIQNNLQYVAATNLDAATFQVSYQMKILTTAGFSVLLLRKRLSTTQWVALLCLAIGVGVVQIQSMPASSAHSASKPLYEMQASKGFLAVFAACFTSGLAGVYFEMVLKGSACDLWVRNVQLSLFSLLPALVPIFFTNSSGPTPGGYAWFSMLFRDFGAWAWATVAVQVLGGLVTALVIKYSDNILKGFATSLSIVISFLASVALFDFHMTFTFVLGSCIVLVATWLYNSQPKTRSSPLVRTDSTAWNRSCNTSAAVSSRSSLDTDAIRLPMLRTSSNSSSSLLLSATGEPEPKNAGHQFLMP